MIPFNQVWSVLTLRNMNVGNLQCVNYVRKPTTIGGLFKWERIRSRREELCTDRPGRGKAEYGFTECEIVLPNLFQALWSIFPSVRLLLLMVRLSVDKTEVTTVTCCCWAVVKTILAMFFWHPYSPLPLPCFQPFRFPSSSYLSGWLRVYLLQLRYKGPGHGCSKVSDSPEQLVGFLQIPQVRSNKCSSSQPSPQTSRWPSELDCPIMARETMTMVRWLVAMSCLVEARQKLEQQQGPALGLNYC